MKRTNRTNSQDSLSQPVSRRRSHTSPFPFRCGLVWLLSLVMTSQPALGPAARAAAGNKPDPAATPPVQPVAAQSNADLTVTALDTSGLTTDSQSLIISGKLGVTINNIGSTATGAQFRVIAFEDRDANGQFNAATDALLGFVNVTNSIAASASANLSLALSGTVTFKGNLIYVLVDSENAIAETNETNNTRHTGQSGAATGVSAPVDLTTWQVIQYDLQSRGPAAWSLESNNTVARQANRVVAMLGVNKLA